MRNAAVLFAAFALVAAGCGGGDDASSAERDREPVASGQLPFDQAFIDAMVPHHREAIEMAKAAKSTGLTEPELANIANDVITSQQREIDRMLEWRARWFGSRELGPVRPEVLGVPESELGMGHGSAAEIAAAADVDATFAEMMIVHHKGAVAMAEVARERGRHPEIRELAEAIIDAQQREIAVMEKHASGMAHG